MGLSENIKKYRLEKNLTQGQLAAKLGVSVQAVSKWETSETYPDGALLVPLANELGLSLDELFCNESVSMSDISRRIITLIRGTEPCGRFRAVRDLCWQAERGLFDCRTETDKGYNPHEIENLYRSSYILQDGGFTMVSNGREPFFAVFEEPEGGFGYFLDNRQYLRDIFTALSHPDTMSAIIGLYRKPENYIFEGAILAKDCAIDESRIDGVLADLTLLRVIYREELTVNNRKRVIFHSCPGHCLIALFLIAKEIGYRGGYTLQSRFRSRPLLQ